MKRQVFSLQIRHRLNRGKNVACFYTLLFARSICSSSSKYTYFFLQNRVPRIFRGITL